MTVFNENQLRKMIKDYVKEEYLTYRSELDKIWEFMNNLRDEIKATQSLIEIKNGYK